MWSDQLDPAKLKLVCSQNLFDFVNRSHLLFFAKLFGLCPNHKFGAGFADGLQVNIVKVNLINLGANVFQINRTAAADFHQNTAGKVNAVIKPLNGNADDG